MKNVAKTITGLFLVILLFACGGGGGGGTIGVSLPQLIIDRDNAEAVTAAVLDVMELGLNLGDTGSGSIIGTPVTVVAMASQPNSGISISAVSLPPTPVDCAVNGTLTVSGQIIDETFQTITTGDTLLASFNNCDDGVGFVLNGEMDVTIANFTSSMNIFYGDALSPPYDYDITIDMVLADFSVADASETVTISGDISLRQTTTDGLFFSDTVSGSSLAVNVSGSREALKNYTIHSTSDVSTEQYTIDSGSSGILESTGLDGTVSFDVTDTFVGVGDAFPYLGKLLITGATAQGGVGPSSVRLNTIDQIEVVLDVDEDGNGLIDIPILTTWEALT